MKILFISVVLLLFEFNSIPGYKISHKIQARPHETAQPGNDTEVYEILEDDSKTVKIVYPKAEKPTLREIVYYHVIETPYGEDTVTEPESVEVSTERPFTNSHGFQFITDDPGANDSVEKNSSSDSEVSDDDSSLEVDDDIDDSSSSSDDEETDDEDVNENEIVSTTNKADDKTTTLATTIASDIEVITRKNKEEPVTVETPTKIEVTTNKVNKTEEKKLTRSLLFNQARNKYENFRKKPTLRRRRSANLKEIPEAPMLAPINLNGLPEYVKKLIHIPETKTLHTSNTKAKSQFNEDAFKEELHHKIEDMISSLKSDKDSVEHLNDEEDEVKRVPRTYGMNLTMSGGHVWNELWSKPGVSFDVGDIESTESKEEAKPIEELSETTGEDISSFISHPTEQKPLFINNIVNSEESTKDSGEIAKESEETENEDLAAGNSTEHTNHSEGKDDIYVNVNKPKASEYLGEEIIDERKDEEEIKTNKPKTNKEITVETEKAREFDKTASNESNKAKDDGNQQTDKKGSAEKPELLQQLMENEQFWKWLSSWTETYMELLIQHVKKMVHDEVSRQMKKLKKEMIEDKQKSDAENDLAKEKEHKKTEEEDKGTQTEEMKDDKLTIEGKEIPLTHTSNFDEDGYEALSKLKHRKDKNKNKETVANEKVPEPSSEKLIAPLNEVNVTEKIKDKTPVDVTATNIFGNSVGTDKVTNIFIFYPKDDNIINDLKPFVNDGSNVFSLSATQAGVTVNERFPEKITAEKELDNKQVDTESKIKETTNQIKPVENKDTSISTTSVASEKENASEIITDKGEDKEDEKKVEEGKKETDANESQDVKEIIKEDASTTEKPEPKEEEKSSQTSGDKQESANKEESEVAKTEDNKE